MVNPQTCNLIALNTFNRGYIKLEGLNFEGDFSYLYEFEKLKIGQNYIEVCEGLGLYDIENVDNTPFLIVDKEGALIDYHAHVKSLEKSSFNP